MIEWFKNLTLFNWLTLIGFCLALVGFLNAILSLRSRYKDWKGVQNKKAFEKRLEELKTQVNKIGGFRKEPTTYYFMIAHQVLGILVVWLMACAIIATYFLTILFHISGPNDLILLLGVLLLYVDLIYAALIIRIASYTADPETLVKEVRQFIENGAKKNVIDENGVKEVTSALLSNKLITAGEFDDLNELAGIPERITS